MFRVKYKKEQILKGLCCFSIEIAIIWTIVLIYILIGKRFAQYNYVELSQIDASIPKEYIDGEESECYQKDYKFLIKSKDDSYLIYGIELSNIDENSMELPTDENTVKKLKSANTFSQILEGIQDGVGFLWGDVVTGSIEKPSYTMYYFSSMEEGERGDYQVYILFYIQGDLKYMEVCMMDEEHALSEEQKEHMRLYTQ